LAVSGKLTSFAKQRLKVMEKTVDGFKIAEEDLRLRGPGEIFGFKQSGIPEFRIGNLVRDGDVMSNARQAAEEIVPQLSAKELARIEERATMRWGEAIQLSEIA
jgi:ATP-dependent DNA helicase RecG